MARNINEIEQLLDRISIAKEEINDFDSNFIKKRKRKKDQT